MGKSVRWKGPETIKRGIDQTRLVITYEPGTPAANDAFHVLVLSASGTGRHRLHRARPVALPYVSSPTKTKLPF